MSAETYQVGAHFKALNESVLMAPSKILEIFFPFRVSQPLCALLAKRFMLTIAADTKSLGATAVFVSVPFVTFLFGVASTVPVGSGVASLVLEPAFHSAVGD